MLLRLRVKQKENMPPADIGLNVLEQLAKDAGMPLSLRHLNALPAGARQRLYRALLPCELLTAHGIDPITWQSKWHPAPVGLIANDNANDMSLAVSKRAGEPPFITLSLADNSNNAIDLSLLLLSDPDAPCYRTDVTAAGDDTHFGTALRNLDEESRAMRDGLAPAQVRASLGGSKLILQHIEAFLMAMGQRAYFTEPLTYASAWVFERRGFAYVRGHKLMEDIHAEFAAGGKLNSSLDGSTPFRNAPQCSTIRGRAWAIHDGVLAAIGSSWNEIRMVKQIGRSAGVCTAPDIAY